MKQKRLGEVADFLNGFAFKSKEYVPNGIRIIRIANVQDGLITDEHPCYYPLEALPEIEKYLLKSGDLLISLTGNVGRVGMLSEKMLPAALNQRVSCIRVNESIISRKYLFYYLRRKAFQDSCIKASKGVAQLNLSTKWLEQQFVNTPPLPEQARIVARIEELFSQLDKAVETLQTTRQQLAVYRQAVRKEAFDIGANAETVEIGEIVDDIRIGPFGTMLHKSDYITMGVPVINPQHIKNLEIHPSASVTISTGKADELSAYKLRKNDIIMGRRGEMGRAAAISETEDGWICGTGSILFRLKPDFDAHFYAQILASPDAVHYLEEHATGTTMKNLNEDIVRHIPVPKITAAEQEHIKKQIDEKNSVCDSIEQTVNAALQQAEVLRQSILKEAFEGRLV